MVEDNDGIADALDGQLRIALTVAAQLGARAARIREELARTRQAQTEQQNRELQARFHAERAAARAELAPVYNSSWWDSASVEQIAGVQETATAWHGIDPQADRAGERIGQEVRDRYGVDVHNLEADPSAVREALARAECSRADAAAERGESAVDVLEAGAFITAAENIDRATDEWQREADVDQVRTDAQDDPDVSTELHSEADDNRSEASEAFDSAERRERFASSIEGKADREVIDARMTAAADQARHPREAVTTASNRVPKARRTSTGQGPQRERHLGR